MPSECLAVMGGRDADFAHHPHFLKLGELLEEIRRSHWVSTVTCNHWFYLVKCVGQMKNALGPTETNSETKLVFHDMAEDSFADGHKAALADGIASARWGTAFQGTTQR